MWNRSYLNTIAALLVMTLIGMPVLAADEYAPKPISQTERCPVCGMYPANYPKWHSQIVFKDGEHSSFDSPMDMFRFLNDMQKFDKRHGSADIGKIYVLDYEKRTWLEARRAFFVSGSSADGPMGADLPAFASKEHAIRFTKKSGGQVLSFEQITPMVINGMHMP